MFVRFIENIGDNVIKSSIGTYDFLRFFFTCLAQLFSPKSYSKRAIDFFIEQIYYSCIKHLFSFLFSALSLGSIFIVIAISFASNFGLLDQIGDLLVVFIINEFSPIFTAIFFILAYSISSHEKIQNIKKDKENIINEIYVPKILNSLFMMPLMTLLFATIMIASGYVVSYFYLNINLATYKELIITSISFQNIFILLGKSFVFGFISIFVPIFFGHNREKNSMNMTATVVKILVIILSMLLLTQFLSILIFY